MTDHVTIHDRVFKDNALPNRLAELLLFEVCDELMNKVSCWVEQFPYF